jgi:DNA processing protein
VSPTRLHDLAAEVVGPTVDPQRIARLVARLATPRRGPEALRQAVVAYGGDPAEALDDTLTPVASHLADVTAALLRTWAQLGVQVASVVDPAYPRRLATAWPHVDVPPLLAWRGQPPDDDAAVAIVGARKATSYGTGVAAWLAEAAAAAGVRVVSGGAVGIDAAAHRAAVEGPGGTTVVLGCGHAVPYPRAHTAAGGLFDRVLDHGGTLLSEHLPHAPPHAGHVRARNRIVAGLADVVVVVEGGARSGALVTATVAAERGVPVLAVPGDVRAPGSVAPHRLLAEGAGPCTSPAELLESLGTGPAVDRAAEAAVAATAPRSVRGVVSVLPDDLHGLLAAAWPRPLTVDDLAAATGRPAPALLGALTRARVAGEIAEDTSGIRLRRAPR